MDRRFTLIDFFLFLFLGILFIAILTGMYMVDRQWLKMAEMQKTMTEQAADLRGLREALQSGGRGVVANVPATSRAGAADESPPAFRRALTVTRKQDYAQGDWLVQSFPGGLKTISPLISTDAYASEVQGYVLESLITRDPDTLEWRGLIAKDWNVSADGLTYTFHLRKDVTFSDGKPVTADDVAFTYQFIMDPRIAAPRQRAYLDKIESVTAAAPDEVSFRFKEPYFQSLELAGGLSIMPKHFYEPFLAKPEEFNQSKGLLLGSGPYRLKDPATWTPDQGIVELERNPRYWGPVLPSFDRLVWKLISNDKAQLTTFRNGEMDVYGARPREYKDLKSDTAIADKAQNLEYMSPVAGYSYIGWNEKRAGKSTPFADARVRQAMTFLTDRKRIVQDIFLGYGEIAQSPFSPRSRQHAKDLPERDYDVTKAKALLAEAGYQDRNGDGVLEDAQGKPFEFELVYSQGNDDTQRMVLLLKDLYARAGVVMHPKPSEWPVMLEMLEKKTFDAITLGWTSGVETDLYQIFHSSQMTAGGDDFVSYSNAKLDALIERARATVDEQTRMPIWQEAERMIDADQPYTFLVRRKSLVFIDKRIQNVAVTKLGLNRDFLPVEWYVPQAQQKYTH